MTKIKPKKPKQLSPRTVRRSIGQLENRMQMLQVQPLPSNILVRNRQIYVLERMQVKVRQLYMLLHDLEEKGRVILERQRKQVEAWDRFVLSCNKAGVCPESKAATDEECVECEHFINPEIIVVHPDQIDNLESLLKENK